MQPSFGSGDEVEDRGVCRIGEQLGFAFLLLNPQYGVAAVGVDGDCGAPLLQLGQPVYENEKFSDVVGALFQGPYMEQLDTRLGVDTPIFHFAGIPAACGVDR